MEHGPQHILEPLLRASHSEVLEPDIPTASFQSLRGALVTHVVSSARSLSSAIVACTEDETQHKPPYHPVTRFLAISRACFTELNRVDVLVSCQAQSFCSHQKYGMNWSDAVMFLKLPSTCST